MKTTSCCRDWKLAVVAGLLVILPLSRGLAVTSKITHHAGAKVLLRGNADGVVVTSPGAIQLGRVAQVLVPKFEDVWSVNCLVACDGAIFLGTSPNGHLYRYRLGTLTRIYPAPEDLVPGEAVAAGRDPNKPDPKSVQSGPSQAVKAAERFTNQHIFAMAVDAAGRLLVGFSGKECRLCRREADKLATIFEPHDAKYIFDIQTDGPGNIYLATGPEGLVYALDPSGQAAHPVHRSPDKNILTLTTSWDGFVYAGGDTRGLVYKIDPCRKTATALYDSDEPEVSALLAADGSVSEAGTLYAAVTTAKVGEAEERFAVPRSAGRPEARPGEGKSPGAGGLTLQIAATGPASAEKTPSPPPAPQPAKPKSGSAIYRIDPQGYVSEVFRENAAFLCLAGREGKLLVGSGNEGRLYLVDREAEQQTIVYEDKVATQISAVLVSGHDVYLGTANPARLVLLSPDYAAHGTYTSDLVDAGQSAQWGKLHVDAEIPRGCRVLVSSRSGNVKDVNDPTFSAWTEPTPIAEPVQLRCPVGRFCQYRLTLETDDARQTPIIREVAVASTVPNLAPKVESIDVARQQGPGKEGVFKISYKASDENGDKLVYRLDFRRVGRTLWIAIKDKIETDTWEWDSKTVEDGRYEIRVTAGDERSNSEATRLTGRRISEPIVVDNTGPVLGQYSLETSGRSALLRLKIADAWSVIGRLEYTIDSHAEWKGALPDDGVYDTTEESFTLTIENLEPGEHVIALKTTDGVGNATFRTFDLSL
jgi:hypothetical protein